MSSLAGDFVEAFNQIDRHLRRLSGEDRSVSFTAMVEKVSRRDRAVNRFKLDLREYADLRNAIVHDSGGGQIIAEPHADTVMKIRSILRLLTSPPQIGSLFNAPVLSLDPKDNVGSAAAKMRAGMFSQLPVYEVKQFHGLLTTSTLAWWLAAKLEEGGGLLEDEPVGAVLDFTEDPSHVEFLSRDASVFDAIETFEGRHKRGIPLSAILITHSGKADESPIGIITAFDLPELFRLVDPATRGD